jgi:beta-phosphoglucomutase-like phosphatase (HAD superfamily)
MHPLLKGKTLLFDVDGTIAETEGDGHLHAFNRVFEAFGLPWRWSTEQYGRLLKVTGGYERMLAYASEIGDPIGASEEGRAKLLQMHKRKNAVYAEHLAAGGIRPRKGLIALLQALQQMQQPWAVVTTTSLANWKALWECAVLRQAREDGAEIAEPVIAVCGEDVSRKKPDPEAYLLALKRLGLTADQCVAIEDSRNGLAAAGGAGIATVIVRSQFFGHEHFAGAAAVVGELSELL